MQISINEIIAVFPPIKVVVNKNAIIKKIIDLDINNKDDEIICWCNLKNISKLAHLKSGTVIIPEEAYTQSLFSGCNYIVVENPRQYFNEVLTHFFWKNNLESSVSESVSISPSSSIGISPFIGDNVVIKENCTIGDHVRILNNTIIYPDTIIENNVVIGSNNVIGNYGFGYEKNKDGNYALMPHIGNVIIRSNVEIGSHNCIDRSVLGSTVIDDYTKIHNFVQIAHGSQIGKNCLITANVTISGGTIIGNNVWIGPGVTISNKLKIGNNAHLSIGSVILADVPENASVMGNPGRIFKKNQ